MRSLAAQLCEVGVEVPANRVATRILNGLGQEYKELKYALRARPGNLTVELVTQHLLTAESDNKAEDKVTKSLNNIQHTREALRATTLNTSTSQVGRQQTSGSMHRPMAMAMTTLNDQGECPVSCYCSIVNVVGGACVQGTAGSPLRTAPAGQWRYEPYAGGRRNERAACTVCGNYSHTDSSCWETNPHLKLRWMAERDTWRSERGRRPIPLHPTTTTTSSLGTAHLHTVHSRDQGSCDYGGYRTAYQDPSFLSGPPPNQLNHAQAHLAYDHTITAKDGTIFIGPGTDGQVNPHATAHHTIVLNSKDKFGKEFCYSIQAREVLNKEIGSMGMGDEPGTWLVDSRASNHYSPFKHLFLCLIQCNPPVDILTGNG